MKFYMPAYGFQILEAINHRKQLFPAKPEDVMQVEEVMRGQSPTFDGLTKAKFTALARQAWDAVRQLRVTDPKLFPTPTYVEVPPEPARSDGIIPNWVMTVEQLKRVPPDVRKRWSWETIGDVTTGRKGAAQEIDI